MPCQFQPRGLCQLAIILNHFEGLNLSLTALKISHLEQLNNVIFALLSTRFYCLKTVPIN
ncbi:hypothetical protein CWC25_12730 [Pseudoalteromonas sp. S4389]|nr:hypothetical protein CWC25_12730 [Pseudoalteromonas sp. S4389]